MQTQYSFQPTFRPALIPVNGCANYACYREELETIDDILRRSGLDGIMIDLALQKRRESIPEDQERRCDFNKFVHHSLVAWRLRLLIPLLDSKAVRDVEKNLADSSLHQWFCHIGNFGLITSPGKSTIDRYKNWYDQDQLRQAFGILLRKAAADATHYDVVLEEAVNLLGFEMPTSKSVVEFAAQMEDDEFGESQQRRAQTEGRVGIIKNVFMSGRSLSKGMDSRRQELSWIMLSHNLRVLARKRIAEKQARANRREALAKTG